MNTVLHKLLEDFSEELSGANDYLDLADMCDANSVHHGASHTLRAIALDEVTHASSIKDILMAHGVPIPEEHCKALHTLKERIHLIRT